jgi:Icc-related predicted phosphoesterase
MTDSMNIIRKKYSELRDIRTVAILADPGCRAGWRANFPPFLERVWRLYRPELFLVAGDLAINGTREEYEAVLSAMKRYQSLLAAVPGDHDLPLKTFMRYFGSTRKVIDAGEWRFVGINTANRAFPKSEAEFLEAHLRSNTVILSHTPPGVAGWTFHSLQPIHSERFLSIIDRHASKIRAAFFGHIHGYSRRARSGVPLIATGGIAESWTIRNNCYAGPGKVQMMLFHTATGKITQCKIG